MTYLLSHKALAERWSISTKKLADLRRIGRAPAHIQTGTAVFYSLASVREFERRGRGEGLR